MNLRLLGAGLVALLIVAGADGILPTAAFQTARRAPEGDVDVVGHGQGYVGVVAKGGSVPSSGNLTVAWVWNNATTPLTFTARVVSDPNNVVTRLTVAPATTVGVGQKANVTLQAHGPPNRDFPVVFEITGSNPGVMRATVTNLNVTVRILPGPGS